MNNAIYQVPIFAKHTQNNVHTSIIHTFRMMYTHFSATNTLCREVESFCHTNNYSGKVLTPECPHQKPCVLFCTLSEGCRKSTEVRAAPLPLLVQPPNTVSLQNIGARTTVTFPIDDHYNILAPTLKIYPTIFFKHSQQMTDPLRHLVC